MASFAASPRLPTNATGSSWGPHMKSARQRCVRHINDHPSPPLFFPQGRTLKGLIHVADWYQTFCHLAGLNCTDSEDPFPLDSYNMWPYIAGREELSPRLEVPLGTFQGGALIRSDGKKIVMGKQAPDWWCVGLPGREGRGCPLCSCSTWTTLLPQVRAALAQLHQRHGRAPVQLRNGLPL